MRGWSAETLAGKTSGIVSLSTVRRIEDDDPKVGREKIAIICRILGLEFNLDTGQIDGVDSASPDVRTVLNDLDSVTDRLAQIAAGGLRIPDELHSAAERISNTLSRLLQDKPALRIAYGDRVIRGEQLEQQKRGAASTDAQTRRLEREKARRKGK